MVSLMERCWDAKADQRPSFAEIVEYLAKYKRERKMRGPFRRLQQRRRAKKSKRNAQYAKASSGNRRGGGGGGVEYTDGEGGNDLHNPSGYSAAEGEENISRT